MHPGCTTSTSAAALALALIASGALLADGLVELEPSADATLLDSADGERANGSGQFVFAGRTFEGLEGRVRRALLRFDLSSIPADATIVDASLTLVLVQLQGSSGAMTLHRVASPWTTGASDPSGNEGQGAPPLPLDCTWLHASSDGAGGGTPWSSEGGDFAPEASASALALRPGEVTFAGTGLVADLQAFVDGSRANFGWMIRGDESQPGTARRFDSADAEPGLGTPPRLVVAWTRERACTGDLDDDGVVDAADLAILLGAWSLPGGDLDGDGTTGGADVALLLSRWGACD